MIPKTTTAPKRSGPTAVSSTRRTITMEPRSPSPTSHVSESSIWPSASMPSTITPSARPLSHPGRSRNAAGVVGWTMASSVKNSAKDDARLPAMSAGSDCNNA